MNELSFYGDPETQTGLTITCRVYDSTGSQVGADVSTSESVALAIYTGDMPTTGQGSYAVRFFDGTTLLGQGSIEWSGAAEITLAIVGPIVQELHSIAGLDVLNPMTVTPTSRSSGAINQTISGDGITTSTITRD